MRDDRPAPASVRLDGLDVARFIAFVGMGTLEALGLPGGQSPPVAMMAALAFCALSVVYNLAWSRVARRGPIEPVMRRLAG